jgi:hypothetical protein
MSEEVNLFSRKSCVEVGVALSNFDQGCVLGRRPSPTIAALIRSLKLHAVSAIGVFLFFGLKNFTMQNSKFKKKLSSNMIVH